MKIRFVALILLSGLIGCENNNSSITVQNESRTQEPAGNHTVKDREAVIEHVHQTIIPGRSSRGKNTNEPDDWDIDDYSVVRGEPCATTCGDNVAEFNEECDGTDDADCPSLCIPPGETGECTCGSLGACCDEETGSCTDDLREWELGLLLYSLELEDNLAHKLGMGKALGFGSVQIDVKNISSTRGEKDRTKKLNKMKLVEKGLDHLKISNAESLNKVGLGHIKDLRELLWFPQGDNSNIKILYPQLEDKNYDNILTKRQGC